MTRTLQALALARPSLRTLPWVGFAAAAVTGAAVTRLDGPPVAELRLGAVSLAVAAAFALEDPAGPVADAGPLSRKARRTLRMALVVPAILALWGLVLAAGDPARVAWPLTLELGGLLSVAFAVAIALRPMAAAPILLLLSLLAVLALPAPWAVAPDAAPSGRWQGIWVVTIVSGALAHTVASRDPAGAAPPPSR